MGAPAIGKGRRLIAWAVASRPFPGESRSGDLHLVEPFSGGVLLAAVDGLGHGPEAGDAAAATIAILASHAGEPVAPLVQRCHQALTATRGVAISLASVSTQDHSMSWLGVGNVEALLLRRRGQHRPERLLLRGGVVGYRLPRLLASTVSVEEGDLLVFATDGVASGFWEDVRIAESPRRIAEGILAGFARSTDDALALVARVWEKAS
jgi:negative regulator of sigma-B (phosphoserine phosphatase)